MNIRAVLLPLLLLVSIARVYPDQRAGLFGTARDSSGHILAGAEVQVQSESTGARWKDRTDGSGAYSFADLPAGQYKVTVRVPGFRTVSRVGAVLEFGAGLSVDFTMTLLTLHDSITVVSTRDDLDPSRGDSLLMTRSGSGSALPANGADYRMLFDLMPGVTITPAAANDGGQFTSNGQRPNASEFRIDGVNVNGGLGGNTLPGSFPGLSLPAMSALGDMENLGSPDTAQSVELRTSGFDAESGERPGALTLIATRSGTNGFHGDFFGRIRDDGWNARDWFANSDSFPTNQQPSWYKGGATLGGPIRRNRTFFFLSAEGSHLTDYAAQLIPVPALSTRQSSSPALQALLESFPYPVGPGLGGGVATGFAGLSTSGTAGSFSARLDQSLGSHGALFFRFVDSPSRLVYSQVTGPGSSLSNWRSMNGGITAEFWGILHEARVNYSRARLQSWTGESTGSTQALALAGVLPDVTSTSGSIVYSGTSVAIPWPLGPASPASQVVSGLSIPGLGEYVSNDTGLAHQTQWEFRDTISRTIGRHQVHAGIDDLRLNQSRDGPFIATLLGTASSLQSILDGEPLAVTYSELGPGAGPLTILSLFAQDTFHVSESVNLVYGLRWEITPPGRETDANPIVSGLWTGTAWQNTYFGVIDSSAPWHMRYGQFAPRIGLAWKLPGAGLVLRAGAGLFYDTTLGASIDPINGGPFNSWLLGSEGSGVSGSTAPNTALQGASAGPEVQRFLSASYPALQLPESWQWRTSLEKTLKFGGVASASYTGSLGRHLLGNEAYVDPSTGLLDSLVALTQNSSNYQALQLRYSGSFGPGLFASVAYTWSHSLDDGSQDSSIFLIHPGYQLSEAWASSDFDVRYAFTASLSGRLPRIGWTLSGILRARTGFPINITDTEQALGEGFENASRPDLAPGLPRWINDPSVAGGRRLNAAAFSVPVNGEQGSLGRNAIYGNGLIQIDASLHRNFELFWGTRLEVGVSVFNVLNHPSFADPVAFLSSPLFGQATSMQNLMMGSGTPNTGMPPLFQTGGARSVELNFRFSF